MSQTPTTSPAPAPAAPAPTPDSGTLLGGAPTPDTGNNTLLGTGDGFGTPDAGTAPVKAETSPQDPSGYQPTSGLAPLPENASDDQRREFDNKLRALNSVPNAPGEYGDFGFGADVKIDTEGKDYKYYTDVFHKLGINKPQAKQLLEAHTKYANEQVEQLQRQNEQTISQYRADMKTNFVKTLGGESQYEVFRATAEQGFKATAKGANLTEGDVKGLLNIMGDDPRFVKIFNHIGKNFQEAVLISGATPSAPEVTFDQMFEGMFNKTGG